MTRLSINNVGKTYGSLNTVSGVSLTLDAGERLALLGHNGAGKTTLMRMILGLTRLSCGSIDVCGSAPGQRAARSATGYLPENVAFHGALSGREQLRHFAKLKSAPMSAVDDLLDRVGLTDAADRKIRTYSKGMRQRIGLAQALLGTPKLVLLDEPTTGLDPILRHEFYDIVQELTDQGTAVMLSSHALTELETRTDRIAIMSKGKLVADDTLLALREKASLPIRVNVTTAPEHADRLAVEFGGNRMNGRSFSISCRQEDKIATLGRVTAMGSLIKDVEVNPASLEELYRHYSGADGEAK